MKLNVTCEVNADQREYVRIVLAGQAGDDVIEIVGYREGYASVSVISQGAVEGEQNFILDVEQVRLLSDATDILKVLLMKVARVYPSTSDMVLEDREIRDRFLSGGQRKIGP